MNTMSGHPLMSLRAAVGAAAGAVRNGDAEAVATARVEPEIEECKAQQRNYGAASDACAATVVR